MYYCTNDNRSCVTANNNEMYKTYVQLYVIICKAILISTFYRAAWNADAVQRWDFCLSVCPSVRPSICGFKGEAGEALPPQIFLILKFVVCIALKIIEIVATWCDILGLKGSKFDLGWGSAPNPARGARSAPRPPADPIPALGPRGLETTCLPKYVSLNPLMVELTTICPNSCMDLRHFCLTGNHVAFGYTGPSIHAISWNLRSPCEILNTTSWGKCRSGASLERVSSPNIPVRPTQNTLV